MAIRLVDTDVYSYVTSTDPRRGFAYRPHLLGHTIALSFITVGELYAGVLKKMAKGEWDEKHLIALENRLQEVVVIPYDIEICKTFGEIKTRLTRTVAPNDLWIAACAIRHSLWSCP